MKLKLIMTAILAASLCACGGDGNSSMTAAVVTPPILSSSVVTPSDLQTTVPSLSYVQSSPEYVLVGYQKDMSGQYIAYDYLGAYPSNNQTGVSLYAGIEAVNPFPDLSTVNDDFPKKTSFPISVTVKEGLALKVDRFTVTEAGQSTPLNVRLMTHANDPNAYLASNTAFIIGKFPFKANTVYNVSFSGSAGATAISKT